MYCVKCGKEVAEGTKFCTNCGAEIEAKVEEVKDDKLTYSQNQSIATTSNPTPVESKPAEAGSSSRLASRAGSCRWGYWWKTNMVTVKMGLTKEKLIRFGYYDLAGAYQSVHVNY